MKTNDKIEFGSEVLTKILFYILSLTHKQKKSRQRETTFTSNTRYRHREISYFETAKRVTTEVLHVMSGCDKNSSHYSKLTV